MIFSELEFPEMRAELMAHLQYRCHVRADTVHLVAGNTITSKKARCKRSYWSRRAWQGFGGLCA